MATEPTIEEILLVLEDAVLAEPNVVGPDTDLTELSGWDSSSAVYFMGEALGRWNSHLSASDLRGAESAGQLARLVVQRIQA